MRYGDKDGFEEIYNDKGDLILHPNEKVLVTEENVVPSLKSTWRYYGGDYLLEPSKGTIYLTNERLVFINIPERMFAIGESEESRVMNAPAGSTFELGDMAPGAAVREYFEIPNIEIMGSEQKEGAVSVGEMVNVYVLSSGNQYHLSTVLTSDSDLLMRLMNKKVDNLDQLVNNLKDFFRKTDWMFMEGEKKLYGALMKKQEAEAAGEEMDSETESRSPESKQEKAPVSEAPSTPRPRPKTMPRRKIAVSSEVGQKSKEYFKNLYSKGLIKEDIYRKLMGQYGDAGMEDISPSMSEEPPSPAEPVDDEARSDETSGSESDDDEDLLNMLDSTLTDIDGGPVPEPESDDEEKVPDQRPPRAKKLHRSKS